MAIIYRGIIGAYDRVEIARPNSNLSNGAITFSAISGGSWTSFDDGYYTVPFALAGTWYMNGTGYTSAWASTNGYISFGSGSGSIFSSPQQFSPCIGGNMGDQWLQPGLGLSSGDTQGFWTWNGSFTNDGVTVNRTIIIANQGQFGSTSTPRGYTMCLWSWGSQQYITVRLRNLANPTYTTGAGPYNAAGLVGQEPNNSYPQVWRSGNNGVTWTYVGSGDVALTGPQLLRTNQTVEGLVNNSWWMGHEFTGGNYNSDAGTRSISYNGLAMTPYYQTDILKRVVGTTVREPLGTVLSTTDPTTGRPYGDFSANGTIDISDALVMGRLCNIPTETSPITADNRTVAGRLGQRLRDVDRGQAAANGQIWVMGHGNMKQLYSPTNFGYATIAEGASAGTMYVYGNPSNSAGSSTYQNSPMWSKAWNAGIVTNFGATSTQWQLPSAPVGQPWVAADAATNGGPVSNSADNWTGHGSVHVAIRQWGKSASAGSWQPQSFWP